MHQTLFKVRDYECDMQGIVNNAVYFNYLEHARHEFLLSKNIHFANLARVGINLVVVRVEMDYRASLVSGDHFCVSTEFKPVSKLRFEFKQQVWRSHDNKLMLNALIIGTALNEKGRPVVPIELSCLI